MYYVDTNLRASRYFFLLRDVYHLLKPLRLVKDMDLRLFEPGQVKLVRIKME